MTNRNEDVAKRIDVSVVHTASQLKGHRLRMARALTGLSKHELQEKIGVSASLLDAWESGRVELTEKNALRISNSLKLAGILCSSEWLLSGNSPPPRLMDIVEKAVFSSNNDVSFQGTNAEPEKDGRLASLSDDVRKELSFFLTIHEKSVFHIVERDFLNYKSGDCVAGLEVKDKDLYGQNAIGIIEDKRTILGRVVSKTMNEFEFCTDDANLDVHVKTTRAAEILWHRIPQIDLTR